MVPKEEKVDDNGDDNKSSSSSGSESGEEECLVEVTTGTIGGTAAVAPSKQDTAVAADDASSSSGDSDSGDEEVLVDESGTAGGGPPANPTAMALAALSHYQGSSLEPQSSATLENDSTAQPNTAPDADDVSMADASSPIVSSVPTEPEDTIDASACLDKYRHTRA